MHQLRVSRRPRSSRQPPPSACGKWAGCIENADDTLEYVFRESRAERLRIQKKVEGCLELAMIASSKRGLEWGTMKRFPIALGVADMETSPPGVK
jgi:hypothetical protein